MTEVGGGTVQTREVLRAYRYALDPTPAQEAVLGQWAGAARFAFNHLLGLKVQAHKSWRQEVAFRTYDHDETEAEARTKVKTPIPSAFSMNTWLTEQIKNHRAADPDAEGAWMHTPNRFVFTTAFQNADRAWTNWLQSFKGARAGRAVGYPRFKKRGHARDSFRIHHDVKKPAIRFETTRRLRIPTLGEIRTHQTGRPLIRKIAKSGALVQSVAISRGGTRWYASILVKEQIPARPRPSRKQRAGGPIGVDLGIKVLAALSTGELVPNPRTKAGHARKLTKLSQALARSQKGSNRRRELVRKIGALHHLEARQRDGHAHALTTRLAHDFALIGIEDLNLAGMTRSAKGTIDKPGRNVRAKSGLNRSLLDISAGEIRRQLHYKTSWTGARLVVIDRWAPTSKTCSHCGHVKTKLGLGERTYHCERCGLSIDRDHNAARNIAALAAVAPSTEETQNARRASATKPAPAGRIAGAMKREDPPGSSPPSNGRAFQTDTETATAAA